MGRKLNTLADQLRPIALNNVQHCRAVAAEARENVDYEREQQILRYTARWERLTKKRGQK